jgi:hypothetical protein
LTAICTVCIKAFLKEVALLGDHLQRLGPVDTQLAERLRRESVKRLLASARSPLSAAASQGGRR